LVDAQPEPALPAGEAGGDVQQPVAQRLGFGAAIAAIQAGLLRRSLFLARRLD
jgi:hypothetical protein